MYTSLGPNCCTLNVTSYIPWWHIARSCIILFDAPSMWHHLYHDTAASGAPQVTDQCVHCLVECLTQLPLLILIHPVTVTVTTQRLVFYFTNWQTDTQCLIVCLTSEVLRPNIPYTKWRGLLNHLSSLVLWHSAASITTTSQMKELVNYLQHCKWTRAFKSSSESSPSCLALVIHSVNQITHAGAPSPFWLVRAHFAWLVMNVKIWSFILYTVSCIGKCGVISKMNSFEAARAHINGWLE